MNHYAPWRYALMVVLIILGVIYALPNFYGADPALQLQTKSGVPFTLEQQEKVTEVLTEQHVEPIAVTQESSALLIRFKNTEDQLKAQSYVQAVLGEGVTVALNLAPRTPAWLRALNAEPMKLGLDLRGGIHFLYHVDVDAMYQEQLNTDVRAMGEALRKKTIRYMRIGIIPQADKTPDGGIMIAFRNEEDRAQALSVLERDDFHAYQFTTSKQNDRYFIQAIFQHTAALALAEQAMTQNLTTLRNRVNALGVSEPVIQQQGRDQISVDLPGIQDSARAKEIIGKVATVRLQLVDMIHDPQGPVPVGDTRFMYEGRPYLLYNEVVLRGRSILSATTITDENGRPAVSIRAGGGEVSRFNQITAENVGRPMATVYVETKMTSKMVDGKVITKTQEEPRVINIATINSALGNSFQISGMESTYAAKNLALLLRSGAYSVPIAPVSERT